MHRTTDGAPPGAHGVRLGDLNRARIAQLELLQDKILDNPWIPNDPHPKQAQFLTLVDITGRQPREAFYGGAAGGGKLCRVDSSVLTPFGWKRNGDLRVGDVVVDPRTGGSTRVILAHPVVSVRAWVVTFDDGSSIECGEDHLWTYRESGRRRKSQDRIRASGCNDDWLDGYVVGTTARLKELVEHADDRQVRGKRPHWVNIPVARACELTISHKYPDFHWPIDPYVMGVMLGDGHFSKHPGITGIDLEIDRWVNDAYPGETRRVDERHIAIGHGRLRDAIRSSELLGRRSWDKYIPQAYLLAPLSVRVPLMQGLIDTDGYIDDRGHISYTSVSRQLAEDVQWLARSLGAYAKITTKDINGYRDKNGEFVQCRAAHTVWIKPHDPSRFARLARKVARAIPSQTQPVRQVVSVERTDRFEDMRCITLDSRDGLYIADDFIVTHNSEALLMAAAMYLDVPGYSALILRKNLPDLNQPGALIPRSKDWWQGSGARYHVNNKTWTFPSGSVIRFGYLEYDKDMDNYMGCFHPDTELLTRDGWKPVADVATDDLCATLDPVTREMSYQPVTETWEYDFDGDLVATLGGKRHVSFAVTPNHSIWASTMTVSRLRKYRADSLPCQPRVPQRAEWRGETPEEFAFSSDGRNGRTVRFTADQWASFLGWYLAEGCCDDGRWAVVLCQKTEPGQTIIRDLLTEVGVNFHESERGFSFNNKALCQYLMALGTSRSKRVPRDVMEWSSNHIRLLIEALVEGDGTWKRNRRSGHFVTTSRGLADDVCELAIKCGMRGAMFPGTPSTKPGSFGFGDSWHVSLSYPRRDTHVAEVVRVPYAGKVYCVTVPPHHTVLIRHNGKVSWSGQSEYQFIGFDEMTQFDRDKYVKLGTRLRKPRKLDVPLRIRGASNPGGIGHEWVKQHFMVEGTAKGRYFVPARLVDNPSLDEEEYSESFAELDPVTKARWLNGDWDIAGAGVNFKRDWFEVAQDHPTHFERVVRFWDTAATAPQPGKESTADWTVGTKIGRLNDEFWVLDVVRFQGSPGTVERVVAQTADLDGYSVEVCMEQEPGASGVHMIDHYTFNVLPRHHFRGVRSGSNKAVRAGRFSSLAQARRIKVVQPYGGGAWIPAWFSELESFPDGPHDDQVDSAAGAINQLIGGGEIRPASPDTQKFFAWRSA